MGFLGANIRATITENNMNIHILKKLVEIFEGLNDDIKDSHGSVLAGADYDATEELRKIYKAVALMRAMQVLKLVNTK